jgi:hypothetical protein
MLARLCWAAGLLVAAGCVAMRVRGVVVEGPTDFDDAYMFARYALHLRAGHPLVWNLGEAPVFGVTSLAHLAWVAALGSLAPGLEPGRLLQVASCVPALLAVVVLALAAARSCRRPALRQPGLWLAVLFPLVTLTEAFGFHAATGMDTGLSLLANATVVSASLWLADTGTTRAAVITALVSFAAVLVRPDNLLVAALCPLALGRPRRSFLALLGGLLITGALLARCRLGTALPLAFHAKRPGAYAAFAGEYTWNPYLFLQVFLRAALPFVAVLLLLLDGRRWRRPLGLLAPVALTCAVLFGMNQIMGHLGRFYFPFLSFLVMAAVLAIDDAEAFPRASRWIAAGIIVLAGGPLVEAAGRRYQARAQTQPLADLTTGYTVDAALPELDSWQASIEIGALAAAAPDAVFAMSEHGLVGARAPATAIVDVLGLHDRTFALEGFSAAALWRRRPDLLWFPHPDHTGMVRAILDSPALWADYDVYPDAFTYGVALRRDAPPSLRAHFVERWSAVYATSPIERHKARRP